MKHLKIFMLGGLILVIVSCDSSDERDFSIRDSEYFPQVTGNFHVYAVEEIRYTLSVPETLHYELKTVVADSFENSEGGTTFVIHRFKRVDSSEPWTPLETWSSRLRHHQVIVSKGNIPFVVLNFPLDPGMNWNGNAYNSEISPFTLENLDEYRVQYSAKAFIVNGIEFPDCVSVVQEDEEDLILYVDKRNELYARHVGLISREVVQLKYCNNEGRGCVGQQLVDEGLMYSQTLMEYGKE